MSGDTEVADVVPSVREGHFDAWLTDEAAYLAPAPRPEMAGLRCAFTLRYAGRSGLGFNLGFDRGPRHEVLANRRRLLHALGMDKATLCTVRQVHSNAVCVVDEQALTNGLAGIEADALVTALPHVPIGVLAADCLPIVLYSAHPRALGVAHAGRMGTYHQVVLAALKVMQQQFAINPSQIRVMIGPGIGGCCYDLDHRAIDPFRERFADWESYCLPQKPGLWTMDLVRANRAQLQAAGVPSAHIRSLDMCTVCHCAHLFSHRAEREAAGRGMGMAVLLPEGQE
ncbi:polyphenol oxidase family protein [Candidatus Entotheonella palauensis]|uniref:polyphenol oxidase family protein n=1 Tax=Candidatus Entotheonella palauensis TaxID=93172 RepID=UPI000B7E9F5C|nr:polyphenol oxidase family protein [Candidatus Entotheonella palauensis]